MQTRTARGELVKAHQVVHQPKITTLDFVPVCRSDLGLKIKYLLRLSRGVRDAGEREGCRDMSEIFGADLGVLVAAVVLLVGQAQPALPGKHHIAIGITRVGLGLQRHQPGYRLTGEAAEHPRQVRQSLDRIDGCKQRQNRVRSCLLDRLLVHEAGVQIGNLGLIRARLPALDGGDDVANRRFSLIAQLHECASHRLVGRDLGGIEPRAVYMPKKIILNTNASIETWRSR